MDNTGSLNNCRVLIKDIARNQVVADTRIQEFDAYKNIIKISVSSLCYAEEEKVSALIFGKDCLYEYFGRLRKPSVANQVEIALSGGKEREDRLRQRYDMEVIGQIESILIESQKIVLRKPILMSTKNISANGVLFESLSGGFEVGDIIQVSFNLIDTEVKNDYMVVRIQNRNLRTEEYACRIADKQGNRKG